MDHIVAVFYLLALIGCATLGGVFVWSTCRLVRRVREVRKDYGRYVHARAAMARPTAPAMSSPTAGNRGEKDGR